MVETFERKAGQLINEHFPLKKVTVTQGDLPYFTEELKSIRRQRNRVYTKEGKGKKR